MEVNPKRQKIVLGTAQFGMDYGVANQRGRIPEAEVAEILRIARSAGIDTVDTAVSYGESERVLGRIGLLDWNVVSKIPAIPNDVKDISAFVLESVEESLRRLRRDHLDGLLLHDASQVLGQKGENLSMALEAVVDAGLVKRVGLSIYSLKEIPRYLDWSKFDLIQIPFNLLNSELLDEGWAEVLKASKVEVHVRSIFLQGLLLMKPEDRPKKFNSFGKVWTMWDTWLENNRITALEACLRFALNQPGIDRVVVGVDSRKQAQEILNCDVSPLDSMPDWPRPLPRELLNPVCWSNL